MTPKQEAERIFNQYYSILWDSTLSSLMKTKAKKCAIIDVQNTMKELGNYFDATVIEYYNEVLNELNKL